MRRPLSLPQLSPIRCRAVALLLLVAAFLPDRPAAATDIQRLVSPGGIEAWLVEEHSVPVIAVNFAFRGGSAQDPVGKAGLANLLTTLFDEGAGDLDSAAFQRALEDSSVSISFDAGRDALYGEMKTLSGNRAEAVRLLRLALTEPRFDPEPLERMRARILVGLRQEDRDAETIASKLWFSAAFPDHPYGRPGKGTPESVAAITRNDIRDYYSRVLARDGLKIAIVGDIDADTARALLDEVFGPLPEKARLEPVAETAPMPGASARRDMPNPQTVIRFGGPGLKRSDPDFIPAYVVNYILGGGGFSSRLYNEVREKRGLAYSVYTYLLPFRHAGVYLGGVATRADRAADALGLIMTEIARIAENGPSEEELAKAKDYLVGSYPLRFDSSGKIASQLVEIQLENLGIDYINRRNSLIEAVTIDDVRRTAKRLFGADDMIIVTVGQPAG